MFDELNSEGAPGLTLTGVEGAAVAAWGRPAPTDSSKNNKPAEAAGEKIKVDGVAANPDTIGQLQDSISQAERQAARNVLNDPRWERELTSGVVAADLAFKNHPNVLRDLALAQFEDRQAANQAARTRATFETSVNNLPAGEQEHVRYLMTIKDGGAELNRYLSKHHPQIFDQLQASHDAWTAHLKTAGAVEHLQRIADGPTQSRLALAQFLNMRGANGDRERVETALSNAINSSNEPFQPGNPLYRAVQNIALQAGLNNSPSFLNVLRAHNVRPEEYFPQYRKDKELRIIPRS
ncbi:MAG: hypothetical protein U0105_09010 [Candidatus Obscuribacterales bacterium]